MGAQATLFAAICLSSKILQPLVSALNKPDITVLSHQQYSSQLIIHVEQPQSGGLSPLPSWPHYLSQKQTHCFLAWPAITLHWGSVTPTQLCGISFSRLHGSFPFYQLLARAAVSESSHAGQGSWAHQTGCPAEPALWNRTGGERPTQLRSGTRPSLWGLTLPQPCSP